MTEHVNVPSFYGLFKETLPSDDTDDDDSEFIPMLALVISYDLRRRGDLGNEISDEATL